MEKILTKQEVLNILNTFQIYFDSSFNWILQDVFDDKDIYVNSDLLTKAILYLMITTPCIAFNEQEIDALASELSVNANILKDNIAKSLNLNWASSYEIGKGT